MTVLRQSTEDPLNRGDFNNDGIPDIIVGNHAARGGYGISVPLGKGDGRFQNPLNNESPHQSSTHQPAGSSRDPREPKKTALFSVVN